METDTLLTRREATLRSAATTCLAGIALVQAIELPALFVQGRQLGVLSLLAMVACMGVGWLLAAAPAGVAPQLWRVTGGTAALVLAGWAASHAFAVPGVAADRGDWASMPGLVVGVLAAACLVVAMLAERPTRAATRGLATTAAMVLALAPGIGVVLVALGPGTVGGETVLASGGHLHSHGSPESSIVFQPLPGGGGHYVYQAVATPHHSALGLGLIVGAAFIFTYGAVLYLRRRSEPRESLALAGTESPLAA